MVSSLAEQVRLLWKFLGFFQPPTVKMLHALVSVLVILQFFSSLGLSTNPKPGLETVVAHMAGSWHMLTGLFLVVLATVFTGYCFSVRGLKRYYPYLWGDVAQLRKDIVTSLHFQVVAPRPGGLATVVQGLGFGALLLSAYSGATWYTLWHLQSPHAPQALAVHKVFVLLMVLYVIGHGSMALLHFVLWQRKTKKPDAPASTDKD